MPRDMYPLPGTHAETILNYVQENRGTTTNGVISALQMNPSVVRKCLSALIERGLVHDNKDDRGHHHYSARTPVL